MTHKRFLAGLIILSMSSLVACGGGDNTPATLTFDQALSATQTAVALQEQLAVAMQGTAVANETATQTAIPPAIEELTATQTANSGVITRNEDWTPQEQDFDGVTMVLVPAGCFIMGSTEEQIDEAYSVYVTQYGENSGVRTFLEAESPQHEQCFDTPFWIDKYEVTQSQFAQFGGQKVEDNRFIGDNFPVEKITWFEARDYCDLRGGRLPTEREWEYAARGSSNLVYPWGNDFVSDNVVFRGNSNRQTANVGSRPNGVSWVGALDMSGNVSEWVSSLYDDYPYNADDESASNNSSVRVLRGESWSSYDAVMRSANRYTQLSYLASNNWGFRCVRSQ